MLNAISCDRWSNLSSTYQSVSTSSVNANSTERLTTTSTQLKRSRQRNLRHHNVIQYRERLETNNKSILETVGISTFTITTGVDTDYDKRAPFFAPLERSAGGDSPTHNIAVCQNGAFSCAWFRRFVQSGNVKQVTRERRDVNKINM